MNRNEAEGAPARLMARRGGATDTLKDYVARTGATETGDAFAWSRLAQRLDEPARSSRAPWARAALVGGLLAVFLGRWTALPLHRGSDPGQAAKLEKLGAVDRTVRGGAGGTAGASEEPVNGGQRGTGGGIGPGGVSGGLGPGSRAG
jgi:hypothetical protein